MTAQLALAQAHDPIESAAQTMCERKVGGLPVLQDGRLVGIVTETDIFRAFAQALGHGQPGLRICFDVSQGEDAVWFVVELAHRYGLRLASVVLFPARGHRVAVVRVQGEEPPGFVEALWDSGHRVLSVLRT